jgi:hypothetical protein
MKRADLEHLIRAASQIADDDELIIIGSQSVLGQFPDAPSELLRSVEADMYPKNHPDRWELIDGSIGELSPFHDTFGYYARGVQVQNRMADKSILLERLARTSLEGHERAYVISRIESDLAPSDPDG